MFKVLFPLLYLPSFLFAQNVGIGVVNPTKGRLEVVNGSGAVATAIFGADGAGVSLNHNWPRVGYNTYWPGTGKFIFDGNGYSQYLNMTTGALVWEFNGVGVANNPTTAQRRQITFNQNGNVCICDGDYAATLFVGYFDLNITSARFRGTTYHSVFNEAALSGTRHTYINAGKNGSGVVLNDITNGNIRIGISTTQSSQATRVGINMDNPGAILEIKQVSAYGLVLINSNFYDWGLGVFKNQTEPGSDLYTFAGGAYKGNFFHIDGKYYPASDRRLKANIEPLPSLLNRIMALRPVEYEMKYDNPGHIKSIGFIAQEVRPLFPELTGYVQSDELGYEGMTDLYSLQYDGLGPLAIKAIQEQQQTLKQLKQQNDWLRQKVAAAEKAFMSIQKL